MFKDARLGTVLRGCLVAWAVLASAAARAQTVDPGKAAAAQSLFDSALSDMDRKKYATACPKLEEVIKLVPDGIGAKLALAECYEAQGRLASAWSQFALVEQLAGKAGQASRAKEARARAAALRPKLSSLTVEVPDDVRSIPGVLVTRDGVALGAGQWGTPVPVDAGAHSVVVTAPGHGQWKKDIEILTNGVKVSVVAQAPPPGAPPAEDVPAPRVPWQRPAAIISATAGGAGLLLGSILGVLARSKYDDALARCTLGPQGDGCSQTAVDLANSAMGLGDGATVAFVLGGVGLAAGAAFWFTTPVQKAPENKALLAPGRLSVAASVSPGMAGLLLKGQW